MLSKKKTPLSEFVGVRLKKEDFVRLENMAEHLERDVSSLARICVKRSLKQLEKKNFGWHEDEDKNKPVEEIKEN